jgi:cold-inducible RNA-binding protein
VIIPTGPDGRGKGFAFLEVEDGQMEAAIAAMHGQDLAGRTLTVSEARPRPEHSSGGGRGERW